MSETFAAKAASRPQFSESGVIWSCTSLYFGSAVYILYYEYTTSPISEDAMTANSLTNGFTHLQHFSLGQWRGGPAPGGVLTRVPGDISIWTAMFADARAERKLKTRQEMDTTCSSAGMACRTKKVTGTSSKTPSATLVHIETR
ncbi:hypothetical protein TrVFT333_008889 [Trichoderma virens FT-333]|nr:hypothetical protein TrVFT333_008889 [Trichoderma virens FT-333]